MATKRMIRIAGRVSGPSSFRVRISGLKGACLRVNEKDLVLEISKQKNYVRRIVEAGKISNYNESDHI